jgi:hypothetical protein
MITQPVSAEQPSSMMRRPPSQHPAHMQECRAHHMTYDTSLSPAIERHHLTCNVVHNAEWAVAEPEPAAEPGSQLPVHVQACMCISTHVLLLTGCWTHIPRERVR